MITYAMIFYYVIDKKKMSYIFISWVSMLQNWHIFDGQKFSFC